MSWGLVAVAGATLVTGYAQGEAAEDAANAQADAADAQAAEARRQFDALRDLLSPYVEAASGIPADAVGTFDEERYLLENPDVAQDWYYHDKPYQHWLDYGRDAGKPFPSTGPTEAVMGSLEAQRNLIGLNGIEAQQTAISNLEQSPQLQAMIQQGEDAILQNASATGGLRGGNTQAALAQFRPQMLSNLIQQQYQNLGGITTLGQNSAAMTGNAGMQTGQLVGNALQQGAAAQAGGQLAQANIYGNTINSLAGLGASYLNRPQSTSTSGGGF